MVFYFICAFQYSWGPENKTFPFYAGYESFISKFTLNFLMKISPRSRKINTFSWEIAFISKKTNIIHEFEASLIALILYSIIVYHPQYTNFVRNLILNISPLILPRENLGGEASHPAAAPYRPLCSVKTLSCLLSHVSWVKILCAVVKSTRFAIYLNVHNLVPYRPLSCIYHAISPVSLQKWPRRVPLVFQDPPAWSLPRTPDTHWSCSDDYLFIECVKTILGEIYEVEWRKDPLTGVKRIVDPRGHFFTGPGVYLKCGWAIEKRVSKLYSVLVIQINGLLQCLESHLRDANNFFLVKSCDKQQEFGLQQTSLLYNHPLSQQSSRFSASFFTKDLAIAVATSNED